jgi:hypothetical protein
MRARPSEPKEINRLSVSFPFKVMAMAFYDILREERVKGRVAGKYKLENGDIGLVVEQDSGHVYWVEFRSGQPRQDYLNLYGLLPEPFKTEGEALEKLITQNDYVDITVSYNRSPLKTAYYLHSVSRQNPTAPYGRAKNSNYRSARPN